MVLSFLFTGVLKLSSSSFEDHSRHKESNSWVGKDLEDGSPTANLQLWLLLFCSMW